MGYSVAQNINNTSIGERRLWAVLCPAADLFEPDVLADDVQNNTAVWSLNTLTNYNSYKLYAFVSIKLYIYQHVCVSNKSNSLLL